MANENLSEIIRRILHLETKVKRIENSSGNADLAKRVGVLEKAATTKPVAPAVKYSTTTKPAPGNMIAKSADIQALKLASIEREVEKLRATVHKPGEYLGITAKATDSDKLDGLDSTAFGRPVFLTTPLTSTSWDGDSRSSTSKTLIDLSSAFGVPAGVKAIQVVTAIRDSGSAAADCTLTLGPNNSNLTGPKIGCSGLANDKFAYATFIVPCNANGDIYYQVVASGTNTLDAYIEIWGYFL